LRQAWTGTWDLVVGLDQVFVKVEEVLLLDNWKDVLYPYLDWMCHFPTLLTC